MGADPRASTPAPNAHLSPILTSLSLSRNPSLFLFPSPYWDMLLTWEYIVSAALMTLEFAS